MSEEIERRLRALGEELPAPGEAETAAARGRVVAAGVSGRRARRPRRGALALAVAFALVAGGAFGVGFATAGGGGGTRVVHEKAALDAGPGFLPAAGWDSVASGTTSPVLAAVAANVPLAAADRGLTGPPRETVRRLGPNGVLLYATFMPTSPQARLPQRLLPLRLDEARPASGATRRLRVRVATYDVDVLVRFGSAHPAAGVVAAAREELGRLAVPACPAAVAVGPGGAEAAKAFVLSWLPAHYPGEASDVVGARASAAAGQAMPRYGQAAHDCGAAVARQSVEVDVTLPKLAAVSASLSELTYFVARTGAGWVVWERAR